MVGQLMVHIEGNEGVGGAFRICFFVEFYDLYAFYNKASKIKIVVHGT